MKYIQRAIEPTLLDAVEHYPVVTIYGPRQSGKTTLAWNLFPQYSYANLEDYRTRLLAKNDPYEFFTQYPEPVIIDEIQEVPELLSQIQVRADQAGKNGRYIITGSRQIELKKATTQSLAGRNAVFQLLPLSIKELADAGIRLKRDEQLLAGCLPKLYQEKNINPFQYYKNYVENYLEKDIARQGITDLTPFFQFLQLVAGRTGQLMNYQDISGNLGVSAPTVKSWFSLLEASHVIYILHPWYPSRDKQIVKTPKVYFCDTGLACYLLNIANPDAVRIDRMFGSLFENLVVLEAVKANLAQVTQSPLFFFRNNKGVEVDLLIQGQGNILRPFEIKGSQTPQVDFARNMMEFQKSFPDKAGEERTIIYSGDAINSFQGTRYCNYQDAWSAFAVDSKPFVLSPWGNE